jgi:hypothetical protein
LAVTDQCEVVVVVIAHAPECTGGAMKYDAEMVANSMQEAIEMVVVDEAAAEPPSTPPNTVTACHIKVVAVVTDAACTLCNTSAVPRLLAGYPGLQ